MTLFSKQIFFLAFLLSPIWSACQTEKNDLHIIPKPVEMKRLEGEFLLDADTKIMLLAKEPAWSTAADALSTLIRQSTGYEISTQVAVVGGLSKRWSNTILFIEDPRIEGDEAYSLDVQPERVKITARTAQGAFYAVQTLRQLFPPEFNAPTPKGAVWAAPACLITDYPRFGYRGMHLDVARHFFPVEFVKKYIDLLAQHKINRFHWHLTDDQGWRVEIKRFPRLQATAACRSQTLVGHYSDQPHRFDEKPYCHYYTQAEIKEVVEYAKKRFVTIIPEIEMPGHALAALAAYPDLGCTGGPYETAEYWGIFDDVFCAGNENVFEFLDGVLSEVCELFPGQYIHIGGDECPKTKWQTCAKCQKRKAENNLKDEHELQSYFIRRIEKILVRYDKKLIGWDEILEGGLAPTATVMSWRGEEGGIAAAQSGHDAIMCPGSHCYFDHYQSDPTTEPVAIGGFTTLEKTYSYEPVPQTLNAEETRYILGAQANVWTEYMKSPQHVEYMAFPRVCALAEVVWSPKSQRNWPDFADRLKTHFQRLDAQTVAYAKSYYDVSAQYAEGKVTLTANDPDVVIRYTLDGSEPTPGAVAYQSPFALTQSTTVKAAAFSKGKAVGKTMTVKYLSHKASGKPYTLSKQPTRYKGGTTYALTDGVTGHLRSWNAWIGLVNNDFDPVIDLGAPTSFDRLTTHFVNSSAAWIHPPRSIEVLVSNDGRKFRSIALRSFDPDQLAGNQVEKVIFDLPGNKARYVKVVAKTQGVIPQGHPGAGEGAWLFLDEIIVE